MRHTLLAILVFFTALPAFSADGPKESAYDRVMKTQTIRCGYGTSKPWIYQDLQTGKTQGLNVDIMQEIAKQLGLKLDWPEETGWGELPTSLYNGRVDIACSLLWNDPARGKQVAFTRPLFYTAIYAWTREDELRFTGKPEEINNPSVRIVAQDGDMTASIAKRDFSAARMVSVPMNVSWSEIFTNVVDGKADVVFADTIAVSNFNASNPKKLKKISLPRPAAVYGNSLAVGINETALKEILETAVNYMLQTGELQALTADFRKQYPDAIILPTQPY